MDPRTRILTDVKALVTHKLTEGFRPIIMMDANDDWTEKDRKIFQAFISDLHLIDPLHDKYGPQLQATYSRGHRRLDYILVHASIVPAIKRIGTLGMHEGFKFSDHVFLYMDCDKNLLFKGIVNCPMLHPKREFKLEQADRVERFLKRFRELALESNFEKRTYKLEEDFRLHGKDKKNLHRYQTLDEDIRDSMIHAAKSVAKGKCGYFRSPTLTDASIQLHF